MAVASRRLDAARERRDAAATAYLTDVLGRSDTSLKRADLLTLIELCRHRGVERHNLGVVVRMLHLIPRLQRRKK